MTYRKLAEFITMTFSQEQLNQTIIIQVDEEYFPLEKILFIEETSVLIKGQPILSTDKVEEFSADDVCNECETRTRCQSCEFNAAIQRVAQGEEP
jgi:hypothetical protein